MQLHLAFSVTVLAHLFTSFVKADGVLLRGSIDNDAVHLKSGYIVNAALVSAPSPTELTPEVIIICPCTSVCEKRYHVYSHIFLYCILCPNVMILNFVISYVQIIHSTTPLFLDTMSFSAPLLVVVIQKMFAWMSTTSTTLLEK